jgi:hypothetical protein
MAKVVSSKSLTAEVLNSVHVVFVMDKVALQQVFIQVLLSYPISITPPFHHGSIIMYHLEDKQ